MAVIATATPAAAGQTPASVTAFVHVAVIPMDRERVLHDQTVLVEGSRITALGPASRIAVPAGATRIESHGKYLLPGLADMHTHIDELFGSGYTNARATLMHYLVAGVTTVRNLHGMPGHIALRDSVARGELLGPRIYTAGDYPNSADVADPAAIARFVADQKATGYDFIKVHSGVALERTGDSLEAAMLTCAMFDTLVATAARAGLRIATDLGYYRKARPDIDCQLQAHVGSVEHMTQYLYWDQYRPAAGAAPPDAARMRSLAEATRRAGTWVVPTETVVRMGFYHGPSKEVRQNPENLARYNSYGRFLQARRRMIKALQDAGAGLLLGTDNQPTGRPAGDIPTELDFLVQAGLTPYQALVTGTRNVAAYFGTLDSAGTVAVGKRADLVLLQGNPLRDIHQVARLAGVMVGGRWLPPDTLHSMATSK